jgi:hypothetical protein
VTTDLIRRLEDVRPGDIYLGPIGGWVGLGVKAGELAVDGGFHVGPLTVCHIGIVVENTRPLAPSVVTDHGDGTATALTPWRPAKLAQAMPGGAEIVDMTYAQHWTKQCAYARLPEDYPGQAADAAAIARLMVQQGVGYSYGSYAALAAWHWGISTPKLEAWIGRRRPEAIKLPDWSNGPWTPPYPGWTRGGRLPVEAICSVFADQSWSLTGKKIFEDGRPHQCVTPSQLGARLLMGLPGVVWGWPAITPYP